LLESPEPTARFLAESAPADLVVAQVVARVVDPSVVQVVVRFGRSSQTTVPCDRHLSNHSLNSCLCLFVALPREFVLSAALDQDPGRPIVGIR